MVRSVGIFMPTNPFEINEVSSDCLKEILLGSKVTAGNSVFQLPDLPESSIGAGSMRLYIWDQILKLIMERPVKGYGSTHCHFSFRKMIPRSICKLKPIK